MDKNLNKNVDGSGEKDDISKAEARAKRKEAKKAKKGNKDAPKPTEPQTNTTEPVRNENVTVTPSSELVANVENPTEIDVNATDDAKCSQSKEGLSKSELKAQRRAIQEAQRLAKASAKADNNPEDANKVNKPPQNKETSQNEKVEKNETGESKAELRAKRRAIQEAQRLAKEKAKLENEKLKPQNNKVVSVEKKEAPVKVVKKADSVTQNTTLNAHKKLQLFHHLHDYNNVLSKESASNIHSAIIRLGAQYISHTILGSNARCLALLSAIKQLVNDYRTPPNEEFCRSLENNLQLSTNYLQKCRPLAVSMTNALRHIKLHLTQIPNHLSDGEKKNLIIDGIDTYIHEEIDTADKAICMFVEAKIVQGDVILIYGCSSIVRKILLYAHEKGKKFKVIIVDSRPLLEGREMLRKLINAGIDCSYVLINAVSYIMGKATKVLLGAHSLLANGYVMSRAGTAQIALIARSYNKPVLVCCETYKFCERVQTDSIVHNEIGDPEKVIKFNSKEEGPLKDWKNNKYVTPLNLMYDVTPPDLVTAVVTELAILPCTSVPVILRIKPTEIPV